MLPVSSGSWTYCPQPHSGGSTVSRMSPKWRAVSLLLPHFEHARLPVSQLAAVYQTLYLSSFHHFLTPHILTRPEAYFCSKRSNFLCAEILFIESLYLFQGGTYVTALCVF